MDFKVDDRVRIKIGAVDMSCVHSERMRKYEGENGTIEEVKTIAGGTYYRVFGLYWASEAVEPATPPVCIPKPTWRIIIEGDETTSRAKYITGKKVIKTVSAKRHPDDKHNVGVAAKVLVDRLFPGAAKEEDPKYFTGRVVCVKSRFDDVLSVGKIYKCDNGKLVCNMDHIKILKIVSVEELNSRNRNYFEFLEIKED